jgi:hypothetical protein
MNCEHQEWGEQISRTNKKNHREQARDYRDKPCDQKNPLPTQSFQKKI